MEVYEDWGAGAGGHPEEEAASARAWKGKNIPGREPARVSGSWAALETGERGVARLRRVP